MTLWSRLAFAMVLLVVATTGALSFFTYYFVAEAALPRALDRLATKAALGATELEAALTAARQDVLMIQGGVGVAQLAAAQAAGPIPPQADATIRENIAMRFRSIIGAKSDYARLRIIGSADGGRELVRVERSGPRNAVRTVPDVELRREGERDFFKGTMALPGSGVYVSPIVANYDASSAHPAAPTFQIAMPLPTPDGRTFGIGVIDFDLGPRLERIGADVAGDSRLVIVNVAGEYLFDSGPRRLIAPDASAPARIQDDFPEFKGAPASGRAIWRDPNGARHGVGWQTVRMAGEPGMTILVAASYAALNNGFFVVSHAALAGGAIAVLLALALAVGMARSLSRPLAQMTRAVDGLSRRELVAMPAGGGREIEVLAAAFIEMSTQLGAKQNLLENTLESIRDSVVVADENGVVVVANAAARRLLGVEPGFESMTATRKFACFLADDVTPMPISASPLARALRGEIVDDLELAIQPELPGARAYVVANARSLRDATGTLRGAVTVLRDISEQRRAHEALVDSEQVAQAIIKTALDAFVQTDEKGWILDWSPQAEILTGWTRAEAVGDNVGRLVFPEPDRAALRERIAQLLKEAAASGTGMRYETRALHRDGHEFICEASLTALRRGDGYIINGFVRDITQRRAAEEQLIQAQKMESVGQLTGGIAHDFNNMLTVITGTIEILADGVKDVPHLATITKLIGEAADRGAELTASLLAFARKQPLRPAELDVNELIGEAVRLLSPTLGKQIEIETALSGNAWSAFVDRSQLSSALVNLAINARDAMPLGGQLRFATGNVTLGVPEARAIGVERAGDYVAIEVRDTGTGMPQAILERIFDPFFSTKEVGQGTGLGLSMVFGFAKQSGGSVEVSSSEGHGTTFRIYLPKADMSALQPPAQQDLPVRGGNETILCVEDDRKIRDYVTIQLESLGYKVIVAANADEALAIVNQGAVFDLLFTDIVMPGSMNGRQLAEIMMAGRPSLRVLYTSGYSDGALPLQGRAGSGIPLLTKPYRRAELARMLRRCLDPAVDDAGDLIPLPYSVQPDVERFLRQYPPQEE